MLNQSALPSPPDRVPGGKRPAVSLCGDLARRMRQDLRLAIVTLYTLCVMATVTPFAAYRIIEGQFLVGMSDLTIVAVFTGLAALAWNPGWTRLAANITSGAAAAAVIAVVLGLGLSPLWMFSTLVGNFLMADRRVALLVNGAMIGAVALHPASSSTPTDHATLIAVAIMTSLFSLIFAARVDSQRQRLSLLAERDGLTGAFNRRSLDRDLPAFVEASKRSKEPCCLAILDLDDFKRLNDEAGHDAGDRVLVRLAGVVTSATREQDRFYRYGGEEFVLLLPRTSLEGARHALTKLRSAFAQDRPAEEPAVTFSAGLSEHAAGESPEDWLIRADRALFRAKRSGKDRVETE
ncbi:GGDEF domain-containing protein [Wenzhouxiangella sediminis]|uniref:diguanylate cyclase n=1 Tax=Wenzhouxiangella sediminis TaxID=1792836 RepID=A0A3E1KD86_9GAMM|nr:GGDEF domain-containing protein [Wenzhouxiangella sediminis]RFF32888.1 GGDEF domain-containing protein [Wenzhouxiangella sediminis]